VALMTAITVAGGVIRGIHLARPPSVFDEGFYAPDACWYVHRSGHLCGQAAEVTREHPPLAKWLIGAGIELLGYHSRGWRIAPLVAGTITIPLLYLLTRRLTGSTVAATVAAGLLAVDFLHFLQSRLAMLDVFVTMFGVAAVLFAVIDRDRLAAGALRDGRLQRPWRLAAGIAGGAAVACKWSGLGALAAVIVLALVWEAAAGGRRRLAAQALPIAGALVVAPFAVYVVSYAHLLHGSLLAVPWSSDSWWWAFARRQHTMLTDQSGLTGSQPYESPPWSWPLVQRPVLYFFVQTGGRYREILALGDPLVWWPSVAAIGYAVVRFVRSRNVWGPEIVITAAVACTYLPWFVVAAQRQQVFLFYLLPTVPFMCLALGMVAGRLWRLTVGRIAVVAAAALAVAAFAYMYPLLTGNPLTPGQWHDRVILRQCPQRLPQLSQHARPPSGWCWV
jgi:dolichyl-phosphate-mannose-protein mannosyltransferase